MNGVTTTHACTPTAPLTFAVRFEIPVHRWGLTVADHWPARRGLGTWAEAHMGRWGDLFSEGGELHGARGHGHIVHFMHRLWQTAWVMVWRGVGTHGYIVLVYLFCGLAAHWHHSFVFLWVRNHTYMFTNNRTDIAGMRLRLNSGHEGTSKHLYKIGGGLNVISRGKDWLWQQKINLGWAKIICQC